MGDAIGLPHEGLHPRRIARRLERAPLRHRMVLGRGMLSDDTEHAWMVGRALAESKGELDAFTRAFARQLRRWVLALPPGVGLATLRGTLRLVVGVPPERSGVHSAGNGPAMRSALLGVYARDDAHLAQLVRASTRMTHTDPRAEDGALLVARLARQLAAGALDRAIVDSIRDPEFRERARGAWTGGDASLEDYRQRAGYERGVSGFVVHTVPAALYCVMAGADARASLELAVRLGGDTDTTAAIVGALVGARDGVGGLPQDWLEGIWDWPLTTDSLDALARALASDQPPPRHRWLAAIPRNLACIAVIVGHVTLRLLGR
ncbi:probable dinitrogenase reductase activating glycohydrolase (draG) [Plesiocystis pacifica SIR-1]|uniref:Probable dinitrogenase reductase activating glycohydrolase (DraG) n=1 Tax=Plesiocystis pacifica SIR-1 TaxID=391625 RepID=A6G3U4_9BACT|nr:probable dinitrogenase reductase activating glycohydrolase (draG) [Plesiocystis pacifica SIR-1]